jgi:hypothetical protein
MASRRAKNPKIPKKKRYENGRRYLKEKVRGHFAALQHLPTAKSASANG